MKYKKYSINLINESLSKFNIKCNSTCYVNLATKMKFECQKHHIWDDTYPNVVKNCERGCRGACKECYNEKQYNIFITKILENAGRPLFSRYLSANKNEKIICSEGHVFYASFADIVCEGSWCAVCANNVRYDLKYCSDYVKEKYNGKCLSTEYINSKEDMDWECEKGHTFAKSFSRAQTCWCAFCSKKNRHTIEECQEFAATKNGKCLSTEYKNCKTKLTWQCEKGHIWYATFDDIKNGGYWCPACQIRITQNKLADIIRGLFPEEIVLYDFSGFNWLKTKCGGKLKIDIFVNKTKLAIEYDGEQHFWPINFGGVSDDEMAKMFKDVKRRDRLKNRKIKQHPEDVKYFIRFNYKEKDKIDVDYVKSKLHSCGVF